MKAQWRRSYRDAGMPRQAPPHSRRGLAGLQGPWAPVRLMRYSGKKEVACQDGS